MFSILLSSTGLVVNKHFCLDQLQSISLFTAAESCSTAIDVERESAPSDIQIQKKSCCDDQSEYFKVAEEAAPNNQELDTIQFELEHSSALLDQHTKFSTFQVADIEYAFYKPPLVVCDVIIGIQAFLC